MLGAYASGWMPGAAGVCVEAHLERCAPCRRAVTSADQREAEFIDALPDSPMAPEALAGLLRKLDDADFASPRPRSRASLGDAPLPRALSQAVFGSRRWLAPGLWIAHLPEVESAGWRCYLLRAPAGQVLPMHGHSGPEFISVLSGGFDEGRRYRAGDFIEIAPATHHRLRVTADGPCACLIASKGPLRWRGLARALRPLLSI